jgi:hypothetical protein
VESQSCALFSFSFSELNLSFQIDLSSFSDNGKSSQTTKEKREKTNKAGTRAEVQHSNAKQRGVFGRQKRE